jgi:hypothetical protein
MSKQRGNLNTQAGRGARGQAAAQRARAGAGGVRDRADAGSAAIAEEPKAAGQDRCEAAIKEDEAARLEERRGSGGGAKKPITTTVVAVAASPAHQLLKSRAGRKDDSWIVAAFALLCVLVFVCALYL